MVPYVYRLHSTFMLSSQTQSVISWAQRHWRTGSMLEVFVILMPNRRANILLLPSSLTFPVFLPCVVPAGCPWSLPACQAQHTALCSKAYGQQNKELAAGIWMWHKLNCFQNRGMCKEETNCRNARHKRSCSPITDFKPGDICLNFPWWWFSHLLVSWW